MIDTKLETFLTVCKEQSYTLAAKELNLTQPAVSQHIKALEAELNIKIFKKMGSDLKLTNEGQILYKYARRITSIYKELSLKLEDEKKQTKSLVIGISHTSESNIIAEVLALYCTKNEGLRIKVISDDIKNLYDKLSTYEIDLAIIEEPVSNKKYKSILLDTDSLLCIMNKNDKLAQNKIININDLKKESLILRSKTSQTRTLFQRALENINMSINDFNIMLEIDNTTTIKDLIIKDYGISILPKSVCYHEIKNNILIARPIENSDMIRPINLVFIEDMVNKNIILDIVNIYNSIVN